MIGVGILGTASIARAFFERPLRNVRIVAVASRTLQRAEQFAGEYDIPRAYGSYDRLIADPSIDAVYIPLPQHLHSGYVTRCAQAGKHVLVEKPAALNAAELEEMLRACRKHKVLFMEALMYRFMRVHHRAKEIVEQGKIGKLRYIDYNFSFDIKARGRKGFRLNRRLGGGAWYDLGIYGIDFLGFVTGKQPVLINSYIRRRRKKGIDEFSHAVFKVGEIFATVTCGFTTDANYYTLSGEAGAVYSPVALSGRTKKNALEIHWYKDDRRKREEFPPMNPYCAEMEHFARCIERRETPVIKPEESLRNLRVLDGIFAKSAVL